MDNSRMHNSRMHNSKLVLDSLSKAFPGPLPVLDGVAFDVAPGEFVSVIGPSGCGKSTLFNVIAGLERPDAGRVLVDGEDATGRVDPFAYMPQRDLLFPWRTVLDNTTLGLEVAGMSRRGMRQRAALLRTVVQDRAVLLLDEPFGALDSLTRTDMQAWLEDVRARFGWTVLLITHDIREAAFLSDRVVVLGPRPTRVAREVVVDLPRPRRVELITSVRFAEIEAELLAALRGGSDPIRSTA
jgi:ABC-type nitrate/sulfonate/bicarbonate transport system ATPase subunit